MPKKSILIVEDERALREALNDKLTGEGFAVLAAHNGEKGLEIAFSKKPDIILLDIVMPVMDGVTMLIKLREDAWGKTVPVIMLTNLGDADNVATCADSDVFDYLVKSDWKIQDVAEKISQRLNQ